jgi:hypothetical protein
VPQRAEFLRNIRASSAHGFGNHWLASLKGGLLVPPVVPSSMNCLLNPSATEIKALNVQVVGSAPIRQTAAQALASKLLHRKAST